MVNQKDFILSIVACGLLVKRGTTWRRWKRKTNGDNVMISAGQKMVADVTPRIKEPIEVMDDGEHVPFWMGKIYCSSLSIEKELECLVHYWPEKLTYERLVNLRNQVQQLLNAAKKFGVRAK